MADNPDRPAGQAAPAQERAAQERAVREHAVQEHAMTRTEPGGEHRAPRTRPSFAARAAGARRRAVGALATAISVATTAVVAILAVHIVFVAFEANTANDIVHWFGDRATDLCWQFRDVFQPANHKADIAVNYGLAALVYLVVGRIIVGIVRRWA
ncbi:hypothetical protein [Actinomadura sp.]|uniref:hypothetical protein n=1 Tax=Actinomadura sp. TaxID=1989 RepID=UPI0037C928AF